MLGTPPALILSQDQTLHKTFLWSLELALKNRMLFAESLATRLARSEPDRDDRARCELAEIVRSRDSQKTLPVMTLS